MTLTVTDLFCGAGGSALGASAVPGVELTMAANHWRLAVETHAENFPQADHDVADISQVDPRRYPNTDILWASPECTNHSMAKGKKRTVTGPDLFGETLPDAAAERSRATMWDVPRFAEHHAYRAVIVENVVDAAKWVMWPAWLQAMDCLGYNHQLVFLNSMHAAAIEAPRAPQSRDRMYVVFTRKGNPRPDVEPRPPAACPTCGEIRARQTWKNAGPHWGRYRAQYVYRCPNPICRARIVEPYVLPAASAIDWSMPGIRIGDRAKPLSDKTIGRIEAGLRKYGGALITPSGGTWNDTATSVDNAMRTRTTRETDALVVPVEGRTGKRAGSTREPLRTLTSRAETALVVPYYGTAQAAGSTDEPIGTLTTKDRYGVAFIAELRGGGSNARDVRKPLATVTAAGNHHMLVRQNTARGNPAQMCTPVSEPARTITTAGHQSLVSIEQQVNDCTFRMLEPHEIQAAMAFRASYTVRGNRRERVRQLGNAVTPPAAEFLIRAVAASLEAS